MKLRCLIVDDEQLARQLLEGYISKMESLELVASLKNPIEVLDLMQTEQVDLLFADIQMPEILGTSLVKGLQGENRPMVIFTTAYREYAIDGYELDVLDYMLKPILFERFVQGVNKAVELKRLRSTDRDEGMDSPKVEKDFILLKANHRIYRTKFDDIIYIEGLSEYVTFHTTNGKMVVLESLKNLEEALPMENFVRCHRSFLVNMEKVDSLYGNQLELGEMKIPIGKSYKDVVLEKFGG